MKQKQKRQKGITLIALVITIIVILILAGVAIMTLMGENRTIKQGGTIKTGIRNIKNRRNSKVKSECIIYRKCKRFRSS